MILDLSLQNTDLYQGIVIHRTGGKLSVDLSDDVLNIIGENVDRIVSTLLPRDEITLTGAAPIPVYLVVFHMVVHRFKKVQYNNEMYQLLIARH